MDQWSLLSGLPTKQPYMRSSMKILLQNNHLGWPSDVIAITLSSVHIEGCHILSVTGSKNKEANLCIGPCMACLLGNPCWPNSTKKNAKRPKKKTHSGRVVEMLKTVLFQGHERLIPRDCCSPKIQPLHYTILGIGFRDKNRCARYGDHPYYILVAWRFFMRNNCSISHGNCIFSYGDSKTWKFMQLNHWLVPSLEKITGRAIQD